jgi:hypothetical protein
MISSNESPWNGLQISESHPYQQVLSPPFKMNAYNSQEDIKSQQNVFNGKIHSADNIEVPESLNCKHKPLPRVVDVA